MSKTGSEMYTYILNKFKRTDKSTEVYEALTDIVADMRLRFNPEKYKEEAYIVGIDTLGNYRIPLPSDFNRLIGDITLVDVDNSTSRELRKISKTKYDKKYSDRLYSSTSNMSLGEPTEYCIYANQIYIGQVPDKITYKYQINYTTEAFTEITSVTTEVPFSGRNRNILRSGVLYELFNGLEDFEEAEYWYSKYNDGLSLIASRDNDNTYSTIRTKFNDV